MERLTEPDGKYCDDCAIGTQDIYCACDEEIAMYERLKAYENTGLKPEEIQEAVDLLQDACVGDPDLPKEFESWVERCTWHVRKCNDLYATLREYEKVMMKGVNVSQNMFYGYPLKELVAFAIACRNNGVDEADLHEFANNIEFAIRVIADEQKRQFQKIFENALAKMEDRSWMNT